MKLSFTFTTFDKAILAAVLAPLISLATSYVNGGTVVWPRDVIAAVVAAVVAGVLVYLKGNAPASGGGPGAWQIAPVRSLSMGLLGRLLVALAAAVIAWLLCVFFGGLLALTHAPLMAYVGTFIQTWAILIAILVFILTFFGGAGWTFPWPRRTL
jgi:hypothetical protein